MAIFGLNTFDNYEIDGIETFSDAFNEDFSSFLIDRIATSWSLPCNKAHRKQWLLLANIQTLNSANAIFHARTKSGAQFLVHNNDANMQMSRGSWNSHLNGGYF